MLKLLLKNPITLHFKWVKQTKKFLSQNKGKSIKIGYQSILHQSTLGNYCTLYENCLISNSSLGEYSYIAKNTKVIQTTIGNYCSIGQNAQINLGIHPSNFKSTSPIFFSKRKQCQITLSDKNLIEEIKPVEIGSDVWVGANVIIMGGINIGHGAIIAAGAIVTKDVAPYSIVGGVPAKHIKYRFKTATIQQLLKEQWWKKDHLTLKKEVESFQQPIS